MIEIIDLYVFDGIEHSEEDSDEELFSDARVVIRKLA